MSRASPLRADIFGQHYRRAPPPEAGQRATMRALSARGERPVHPVNPVHRGGVSLLPDETAPPCSCSAFGAPAPAHGDAAARWLDGAMHRQLELVPGAARGGTGVFME
jgi:hypothetical protein